MVKFFKGFGIFALALWLGGSLTTQAQSLTPPSDVQNVEAVAQDKSVRLTWDEAEDDGIILSYKIHYGVTSVTEPGDAYDQEIDTDSDETSFDVTNLINNNTYYFAVTAINGQGLESELYSVEVSATPGTAAGNGDPILISAEHTSPNKVLVTMSEAVQVDDVTEAFELVDQATGNAVSILNTLTNSERVTLVINQGSLAPGNLYQVTATTGVRDFDNNPVSSGVVDSQQFVAQSDFIQEPPPVVEPEEEEEVLIEEPEEEETLIEEEPAFVPPSSGGTFNLDNPGGGTNTADFLEDLLSQDNPINNLPTVDPFQQPVTPTTEQPLSAAPDQTPPQDARNLAADTSNLQSGQVQVSWQPALDIDGDIQDQVLYTRLGLGAWDTGLSLGKETNAITLEVEPNQNYQVRLVTVDQTGNESFGAAFEFSTNLVQSGGGQNTVIALTVIAILGFFFLFAGRRA